MRYESGTYRFNLLPETTILLIEIHQNELNRLIGQAIKKATKTIAFTSKS